VAVAVLLVTVLVDVRDVKDCVVEVAVTLVKLLVLVSVLLVPVALVTRV
jgi:hypothetical protein